MKEKITMQQVLKEQGYTFTTFAGEVDTEQEEPLLPTGAGRENDYRGTPPKTVSEIEQEEREKARPAVVRSRRPVAGDDVQPLYPLGIEIEDED